MKEENKALLRDALAAAAMRENQPKPLDCAARFEEWVENVLAPKAEEIRAELEAQGRGLSPGEHRERGRLVQVSLNVLPTRGDGDTLALGAALFSPQENPQGRGCRVLVSLIPPAIEAEESHINMDDEDGAEGIIARSIAAILRSERARWM